MENKYQSEIRDSQIRSLLERVKKQNYAQYLLAVRLERARIFHGAHIRFDFPVTALIGPNGGGKTTILGAAACAYQLASVETFFPRNSIGDNAQEAYTIEYEAIDRASNPKGSIKSVLTLNGNDVKSTVALKRKIQNFNVGRTLPAIESAYFTKRTMRGGRGGLKEAIIATLQGQKHPLVESLSISNIESFEQTKSAAEAILGKSLRDFRFVEATIVWNVIYTRAEIKAIKHQRSERSGVDEPVPHSKRKTTTQKLLIGKNKHNEYSEFNFGAGECTSTR